MKQLLIAEHGENFNMNLNSGIYYIGNILVFICNCNITGYIAK